MYDTKLKWLLLFLIPFEAVFFYFVFAEPRGLLFLFAFVFNFVILAKPFWGLVILLACSIYDPNINVFVNVYAHTLIILLTFFALIINVTIGRIRIEFDINDILFLLFAVFIGTSILNSEVIPRSIKASLDLYQFILAYWIFVKLINTEKQVNILINTIAVCLPVSAILGYTQGDHYRGGGYVITNPNDYSDYLLCMIFPLVGLILLSGRKEVILKSSAALFFGVIALFLTYSRGAYLALIAAGALGIVMARNMRSFVFAAAGFMAFLPFLPRMIMRFTDVHEVATISFRHEMFKFGLKHLSEHPFFGIGIGMVEIYALKPGVFWAIRAHRNLHNMFLQLVTETGIIGLVSFLAIISVVLVRLFLAVIREKDMHCRGILLGAFLGVLSLQIHGIVETILQNIKINYYMAMLMGMGIAFSKIRSRSEKTD